MTLEELKDKYDELQLKYGDPKLDSIYSGGCSKNADICFVFMNPTARNIAAFKSWKGLKAPWIGTKNIWDLFYRVGLLDSKVYQRIREIKGPEWTYEFSKEVYQDVIAKKYFITNLGKCTQEDARALPDSVFKEYVRLLEEEIDIVKPKVVILFGNQVSSIVLEQKISVSLVRRKCFMKKINGNPYKFYCVYYPIGNGRFNIDKSIEDIKWIMEEEIS